MIRKIRCALTLSGLIVRYKFTKPGKGFWPWLFERVSNQETNEKNRCAIWFLMADALGRKDDSSLCILFDRYGDILNTLKFNQKRIDEIEDIFKRTGYHHLVGTIHAKAI